MKKCSVRCANCHRRKTAKESNWLKLQIINNPDYIPPEEPKQKTYIPELRQCLVCKNKFEIDYAHKNQKYCSRKCTNRARECTDWPNDHKLLSLDQNHVRKQICVMLGVTKSALNSRIKRIKKRLGLGPKIPNAARN